MSRNTVTPRTKVSKATAEKRLAAQVDAFLARNRGLDLAAIKRTIGDRQAFVIKHVPPLDALVACDRFAQANPRARRVIASLDRGSESRQRAMIAVMMAVGVEIVTLAEARAARAAREIAEQAERATQAAQTGFDFDAAGRAAGDNGARLS